MIIRKTLQPIHCPLFLLCHVEGELIFLSFSPLYVYKIYSYVECTSAAIQALTAFKKLYPGHRKSEIDNCISKAASFIEGIQKSDGSWLVQGLHMKQ